MAATTADIRKSWFAAVRRLAPGGLWVEAEPSGSSALLAALLPATVSGGGLVYRLGALPAGKYYLRPLLPDGWSSTPGYRLVTTDGTDAAGPAFTVTQPAPPPVQDPAPVPQPDPAPVPAPAPDPVPVVDAPDALAANAKRLYAAGHPWALFAVDAAKKTGTTSALYGDTGQWAALAYVMTGDAAYAQKAAGKLLPVIGADPTSANYIRENFIELALFYSWLKPALTAEQDAAYQKGLSRWCEWCLAINTAKYVGGFRLSDSDQTTGQYLGMRLVDRALGTAWTAKADTLGVREAIRRFVQQAAGGEWIESSEYNLGTPSLLLTGAYAVGIDQFPEVQAYAAELAAQMVADLTPDYRQSYQWGDEEHPRGLQIYDRIELLAMAAGISGDRNAHAAVNALTAQTPIAGWMFLGWRALYFYQLPQAGVAAQAAPYFRASTGNGHFRYRRDGALFGAHFPSRIGVDHEVQYFGDFQLYDGDEWALTHPLGYGGKMVSGEAANSCLMAGLSSMTQRGVTYFEETADGCRIGGTTSGPYYAQPYYDPPPAFAQWTRSLSYTYPRRIEVRDHFTGTKPARIERYSAADQAKINAAPALWQQVWHCPVQPTETPEGYTWTLPSGRTARLTAPANARRLVLREADVLTGAALSEIAGYQVRFLSDEPDVELLTVFEVL